MGSYKGIIQLGEMITLNTKEGNNIYVCVKINSHRNNIELLLLGSMDDKNYFDYNYIKIDEAENEVFKFKNIFKHYKLVNVGPNIDCNILIFFK